MKTKFSKVLLCAAIVLAVVLLACTFLSKTNYQANLPRVTAAKPSLDSVLTISTQAVGTAVREIREIRMPASARITEVCVEDGEGVSAGDVLFRLDAREFEIEIRQRELAIASMEKTLQNWMTDFDRSQLQAQVEIAQEQLEIYRETVPWEGTICAPENGRILRVLGETGETAGGETLCTYVAAGTEWEAEFALSEEAARGYTEGCKVYLTYYRTVFDQNTEKTEEYTETSEISSREYRDGYVVFRAPIRQTGGILHDGLEVSVTAELSAYTYPCVIPRSAIWNGPYGQQYIYTISTRDGLFGEETYVQAVAVTVLAENSYYAAVKRDIWAAYDVVIGTTKGLTDGAVVVVQ